ncbi:MAG: transcription antitermination factor NusB [Acidobacteria bacterium]|jgi:N utilization substance protein B|nr:transcription antitermination factor NusB [Acidobacteriota bacterium]
MGRRTKARECAFQMLYQWEIADGPMDGIVDSFWRVRRSTSAIRAMANRLAIGAHSRLDEIDAAIGEAASNWRLDRIAPVDRTVLRLGVWELIGEPQTPSAVVLDEAVELAKRFGEEGSAAFVNGVLDAIRRRVRGGATTVGAVGRERDGA